MPAMQGNPKARYPKRETKFSERGYPQKRRMDTTAGTMMEPRSKSVEKFIANNQNAISPTA